MMYTHNYRLGLQKQESQLIKSLRSRGYAVVIVKAGAMERGVIEQAMLKAANKRGGVK